MHEMPLVVNTVDIVDDFAEKNNIPEVQVVVVAIGKFSAVVPFFFAACWDAAIARSRHLLNAELQIEEVESGSDIFIKEIMVNDKSESSDRENGG